MAIRFASGFDGAQTSDLTLGLFTSLGTSPPSIQSGTARNSGRALACASQTQAARFTNPAGPHAFFLMAAAMRFSVTPGALAFFGVEDVGVAQIGLRLNADGTISAVRGQLVDTSVAGTVLATSTNAVLSTNTWYYVEFKGVVHNSTGEFHARVNEVDVTWNAANTGVDTAATANNSYNAWGLGFTGGVGSTFFDDVVFMDGDTSDAANALVDYLGDVRLVALHAQADSVSGAGAHNDSTPSTGTDRGAMVDETTSDGDATYNSFAAAADVDTYKRPAIGLTGTIFGIVERNLIKKSDAGSATARNVLRIGSTDYVGATESPGLGYVYINTIRAKSPATAADFTVAELDAAQTGLERVS